ncbi:ribonuclease III [Baaleninema simplex]|uniref:ribonuclease III n=1 Tax=Baaleninema simplex TaxID=2862350 RepID=UPI00034A1322|nr:ribonuclease III [Baaleninema simplex]
MQSLAIYWNCYSVEFNPTRAEAILSEVRSRGTIAIFRAYGSWTPEEFQTLKRYNIEGFEVLENSHELESKIICDIAKTVFKNKTIDGFIFVGSDRLFLNSIYIAKHQNKPVLVICDRKNDSQLLCQLADEFIPIAQLEPATQVPIFQNSKLLELALTHRSYANESLKSIDHNERLEFLGDSVLNFISASYLYQKKTEFSEAKLTRLRSKLVDEPQLASFARQLELNRHIKLGQGAEKEGGRQNDSLLSDVFEAVVGAYFLDAGIDAVREFVEPFFEAAIETLNTADLLKGDRLTDAKNRFQEWTLAQFGTPPTYRLIEESGPPHARQFTVEVVVNDTVYGRGRGSRKREAEKRAAEVALKQLDEAK